MCSSQDPLRYRGSGSSFQWAGSPAEGRIRAKKSCCRRSPQASAEPVLCLESKPFVFSRSKVRCTHRPPIGKAGQSETPPRLTVPAEIEPGKSSTRDRHHCHHRSLGTPGMIKLVRSRRRRALGGLELEVAQGGDMATSLIRWLWCSVRCSPSEWRADTICR